MSQFRLLGASLDYRRTRFTMDEGYYRAVMRWFVHLYERGFIYRANRIVNWCPRDKTALSDLEVEHEDEDDTLSYVRYPLADGSGQITIATVRPATILADVAVAVHPDDERYRELVGKEVVVPFVERRVPVIADERVETRVRHGRAEGHARPRPDRLRDRPRPRPPGAHRDRAGRPDERRRRRARRADAGGGGRSACSTGRPSAASSRSASTTATPSATASAATRRIEPLVVPQWWLAMEELAAPAIAAVKDGRVRFTPERFARVYLDWMENIRDWCISRQIWWGHRHPRLVLPRRPRHRRRDRARRVRRVRLGRAAPGGGRARHVVLVGALPVRDARLAGRDARARALVPGQRAHDGARDHLPLGRADDLSPGSS